MLESALNCKCANCSQGFCHFCPPRKTNTVTPMIGGDGFRYTYLEGCGKVRLPYKPTDSAVVEASACPVHRVEHSKKGAK